MNPNITPNSFNDKLEQLILDKPELIKLSVNLFPIFGVLFLNWDYLLIIMAYITETFVIGVVNIFKILKAQGVITKKQAMTDLIDSVQKLEAFIPKIIYSKIIENLKDLRAKEEKPNKYSNSAMPRVNTQRSRIAIASFFAFHFNLFVIFQTIFVFVFSNSTFHISRFVDFDFIIGIILFAVSHVNSYKKNYIKRKQYLKASPDILMFTPYVRVFVQQFTIIFGSFLLAVFNTPVFMVIILILLKMVLDIIMYKVISENKKK